MNQYILCQIITFSSLAILFLLHIKSFQIMHIAFILLAFVTSWTLALKMMPNMMLLMLKINKFGYDINKKGSKAGEKKVPQCIGFASAIAFIMVAMVFCIIFDYFGQQTIVRQHIACTLTILATILLGFADDMLDLQWRYKLIFPFFIVLPAVLSYTGSTSIYIPYPLSTVLGSQLDLGILYFVYLTLLTIYSTNAINIYAGINGLQVGQSIVAASSMLILFGVRSYVRDSLPLIGIQQASSVDYSYSIFLLCNFLGSSLALMKLNAYPSKAFVGDTFCYFAGIILAIASMTSQTSIIFHFLFIPQLVNFLYSLPQLLGFVQCPRHRLTRYDLDKDILHPIVTNMNMLNLSLRVVGPTNQGSLCIKLLIFQALCSSIPILLTYFRII